MVKKYDSKAKRAECRKLRILPAIPQPSNAKERQKLFPRKLYKGRACIEQEMGKLKRFKRVALRSEKTAESYSDIVAFACAMILVKSVHTA